MTTTPDTSTLEAALLRCAKNVYRDSNDREIDGLRDALDEALALIPAAIDHDAIDAKALAWAEANDLI